VHCSIAVLVIYIGAKIYYRNGRWVNTATIDLDQGRRFYKDAEIAAAEKKKQNPVLKMIEGIWS
jgi:yeast amino acid transporter